MIASVNFARDNALALAVRGGGHSGPGFGTADDALVIDFTNTRGVRVDPANKTARTEAGATWADFNHATHAFGLATTGGIVGSTGVSGLTLGGGIGYLDRKYGLSCDNLLSADVVTADGKFLTASESENDDLFWALRGGGGNFGVVTSLEFRLHPVDMVHAGIIIYPVEHAETVAKFYREQLAAAPEELGAFLAFHQGPPVPFLPEEWHGKPVCVVVGMWTGDPAEGPARWQPFLDAAPVAGSMVGPMPYPALNSAFDGLYPKGLLAYWKAAFLPELSDGAINAHLEFGSRVPSVQTAVHIYPIDGAVHRVGVTDTAFPNRNATFSPVIACHWEDPGGHRSEHRLGAGLRRGAAALLGECGLHQLHGRRRPGQGRGELRAELQAPAGGQSQVRSAEPFPREPEHPAGLTGRAGRDGRREHRGPPVGGLRAGAWRACRVKTGPAKRRKVFGMRLNC